ncbi:MAG: hypothetical protein IT179_03740 [Acidobacteria bacterium]|nr:hypothetical protein [Acidobacteriota bacterium]
MIELLLFGGLVAAGLAVAAVLGFVFFLIKLVLWVVLLPFRLLLKALMIPVWLTLGALGVAAGAVLLPVVLIALASVAVIGIVGTLLALLLPAVPFILLGLMVWAIFFRKAPAVA